MRITDITLKESGALNRHVKRTLAVFYHFFRIMNKWLDKISKLVYNYSWAIIFTARKSVHAQQPYIFFKNIFQKIFFRQLTASGYGFFGLLHKICQSGGVIKWEETGKS